jgi:mono/diheme cytochrome c family protein
MKNHRASLLLAIVGTLAACSPAPGGSAPTASDQAAADTGARIYSGSCVACHQQDAQGIPGVYPSLVRSAVLLGDPAAFHAGRTLSNGDAAVRLDEGP